MHDSACDLNCLLQWSPCRTFLRILVRVACICYLFFHYVTFTFVPFHLNCHHDALYSEVCEWHSLNYISRPTWGNCAVVKVQWMASSTFSRVRTTYVTLWNLPCYVDVEVGRITLPKSFGANWTARQNKVETNTNMWLMLWDKGYVLPHIRFQIVRR